MDILKIPMSEDQKQQLGKIIDQTKKYKHGYLFAEPVDYMALGILDYPKVIRNPMDFQTLKRNLVTHKYIFLADFLKDAELIFENCRIYNGNSNEGFYRRVADESEKYFVSLVCKMKEYNLNYAGYKKLIGKGEDETIQQDVKNEEEGKEQQEFTIQNIQQLVKKLQEVPDFFMMEYLREYASAIGDETDMEAPEFRLSFDLRYQEALRQLDKRVSDKLAEIRARRSRKPKPAAQ